MVDIDDERWQEVCEGIHQPGGILILAYLLAIRLWSLVSVKSDYVRVNSSSTTHDKDRLGEIVRQVRDLETDLTEDVEQEDNIDAQHILKSEFTDVPKTVQLFYSKIHSRKREIVKQRRFQLHMKMNAQTKNKNC